MDPTRRLRFKRLRRRALQPSAVGPLVLADRLALASQAINESGFVQIGDIEPSIALQGQDIGNPAIVYLHGGPAEAQSPVLNQFVPWERDFAVVELTRLRRVAPSSVQI
jgi:hypothetical protein